MNTKISAIIIIATVLLFSCRGNRNDTGTAEENTGIFRMLETHRSGIRFQNTLTENDSINYFTYSYIYMGGGIAAGDINNDGLTDLYFTGNQVANKLYLNKGNLEFEYITEKAGVAGDNRWYTGVAMADVNGDGFLDIYCSVAGMSGNKKNQLFINNGDGTFTEKAETYGLADKGNSVQATFFDFDKDGDLDVYIANYPPTKFNAPNFYYVYKMNNVQDMESDHLYRNDGDTFTDVTDKAGLRSFGLTLGATAGDLNNDSWPDLYVSNDFNSPDFLWLNNGDGTFREVVKQATGHTSYYGMGVDIADYNNDGNLDVYQVDMEMVGNRRKKTNMGEVTPEQFQSTVNSGLHYQYVQNSLQLHSGMVDKDGVPFFSEVSALAGVSATDWSWAPLFADFDNDGYKDIFVSNGTRREINNNDYFDTLEEAITTDNLLEMSKNMPSEKMDNFLFRNKGDLTFEKANEHWGISYKGFSNGAVYADLDNDGDLEIVTNNIDDYATVFENRSSALHNFITVKLRGTENNPFGIGARVYVTDEPQEKFTLSAWGNGGDVMYSNRVNAQMQELTLTRGFQSSVAPELHFGVGRKDTVHQVKVVWPDGKIQELADVKTNRVLTLDYRDAGENAEEDHPENIPLFRALQDSIIVRYRHTENEYDDFKKEPLLPHKTSVLGPGIAVGDLNGDNLDDFVVGGASGNPPGIFFQTENGFEKQDMEIFRTDRKHEDLGIAIFDANNDGYNDIYIVSGGNEFTPDSPMLQDRLYINNGKGGFVKDKNALPEMLTSGSRVYPFDFDNDGREDLLVLGRLVPGNYPLPAKSYLLKNTGGKGKTAFKDVTTQMIPGFEALGMATDACITDFDRDGWPDIVVVGEWMRIKVFRNDRAEFTDVSEDAGLENTRGWWGSIAEGDFDNDGDTDYIAGNLGQNYKYKAEENNPFDIYYDDFDGNGKKDIVLGYYENGIQYPLKGRERSIRQIPGIRKQFPDYRSFAEATLEDIYTAKKLKNALRYRVTSFSSVYLENGDGKFLIHQLPREAQISAVNRILPGDFDKDGNRDAIIAGNLFGSEAEVPRNDAGFGYYLKGDGKGNFTPVPPAASGLFVRGDVKDMAVLKYKGKQLLVFAGNNDYLHYVYLPD